MQQRYIKRKYNYNNNQDLSPWANQQKQIHSVTLDIDLKPKRKKLKNIVPRLKATSQRKITQKNTIKIVDYQLPPLNRKISRAKQQHSMTIQPTHGRLIKNVSTHRLNSIQSVQHTSLDKQSYRFKLSGRKYDIIPQQKSQKLLTGYPAPASSNTLIFSKNKEDILKRVLFQIQGRIKQLGIPG